MEKQGGLPPCFLFREAYVMKQVTAIVLGAGARGNVYARYAKKTAGQFAVVGVAEPNEARRQRFAEEHHLHAGSDAHGARSKGACTGISCFAGKTNGNNRGRMPDDR